MSRPFGNKNKNGYKMSEKALTARRSAAKKFANPATRIQIDLELFKRLRAAFPSKRNQRIFTDKVIADALDALEASHA